MINNKDKEQLEEIVGKGIFIGFLKICGALLLGMAFLSALSYAFGYNEKDSTDGEKRSGMGLHIDNLTGCHYLSAKGVGLHPRISPDGKSHYGCKETTIEKDTFFKQEGLLND